MPDHITYPIESAGEGSDRPSGGLGRRQLVMRGGALGGALAAAWSAPLVFDSVASPAAAATSDLPFQTNVASQIPYQVQIPRNRAVDYELIGGGGGGGFYNAFSGGSGVKITGKLPASPTTYMLTVHVAQGGRATTSANNYIGGAGGFGFSGGGKGGGSNSNNDRGNGGGGGGGASAIILGTTIKIVAPGGAGAGGGAGSGSGGGGETTTSGSLTTARAGTNGRNGGGTYPGRAGVGANVGSGGAGGAEGYAGYSTAGGDRVGR